MALQSLSLVAQSIKQNVTSAQHALSSVSLSNLSLPNVSLPSLSLPSVSLPKSPPSDKAYSGNPELKAALKSDPNPLAMRLLPKKILQKAEGALQYEDPSEKIVIHKMYYHDLALKLNSDAFLEAIEARYGLSLEEAIAFRTFGCFSPDDITEENAYWKEQLLSVRDKIAATFSFLLQAELRKNTPFVPQKGAVPLPITQDFYLQQVAFLHQDPTIHATLTRLKLTDEEAVAIHLFSPLNEAPKGFWKTIYEAACKKIFDQKEGAAVHILTRGRAKHNLIHTPDDNLGLFQDFSFLDPHFFRGNVNLGKKMVFLHPKTEREIILHLNGPMFLLLAAHMQSTPELSDYIAAHQLTLDEAIALALFGSGRAFFPHDGEEAVAAYDAALDRAQRKAGSDLSSSPLMPWLTQNADKFDWPKCRWDPGTRIPTSDQTLSKGALGTTGEESTEGWI